MVNSLSVKDSDHYLQSFSELNILAEGNTTVTTRCQSALLTQLRLFKCLWSPLFKKSSSRRVHVDKSSAGSIQPI